MNRSLVVVNVTTREFNDSRYRESFINKLGQMLPKADEVEVVVRIGDPLAGETATLVRDAVESP